MSKRTIGGRVGAIMSATNTVVKFFGWGVFEGEEVPDADVGGWMGDALREHKQTNPKIRLDSGKVVWGCECWWGSEAQVQKMIDGRTVENVDIDAARAEAKAEAAKAAN